MQELDLSDFIATKSQAIDFTSRIASIMEKIYTKNFNLEKSLQEEFGVEKKDKFLSLLRKNKIPTGSSTTLAEFLANLRETISNLTIVTITLAIEPNEEILKAISEWFLINIKKQVLIDFKIDAKLIAGCSISYQGKQKDASIRLLFENICSNILNSSQQ